MWLIYAFAASFFAGITAILAKIGLTNTEVRVATAIRTSVVLIFAWFMVLVTGGLLHIPTIDIQIVYYLVISGIATGASWLCYFKALQLGDVSRVTPIDKSSTILTMILAIIFFNEHFSTLKLFAMVIIGIGIILMIHLDSSQERATNKRWVYYAIGAAFFASLTTIFAKMGVRYMHTTLAMAIRTTVVFIMAWLMVYLNKNKYPLVEIEKHSWKYLVWSGITTGVSWFFYHEAIAEGPSSVVVPIDKLSIVITIIFSYLVLKEKVSFRTVIGLGTIVVGTMLLLM